jgi:hypothetical protein
MKSLFLIALVAVVLRSQVQPHVPGDDLIEAHGSLVDVEALVVDGRKFEEDVEAGSQSDGHVLDGGNPAMMVEVITNDRTDNYHWILMGSIGGILVVAFIVGIAVKYSS